MSSSSKGRSGGVLPVNAAARKTGSAQSGQKTSQRTPAPRLRLIIRRLPPGLTETEFWTTLGDEWKPGGTKVEWAAFKDGKISKDPAKPSRPGRAYIKVKEQLVLDALSTVVKESTFQDAKNTGKDSCLLGPPSLEFAPYNKTPSGRTRNDGRQGTIDQDQEFIDFLQSLTEPITKPAVNGTDVSDSKDKVSTTPLVQYIKEKKANKAKEASQAKAAKREGKEAKASKSESRSTVIIKGKNQSSGEKEKVAKATQDAAKASNKSAAAVKEKQSIPESEAKQPAKDPTAQTPPAKRERERGSAKAAARMLQRDLGLVAKDNKAQRNRKASTAVEAAENGTSSSTKMTAVASTKDSPATGQKSENPATPTPAPPTGPRASRTASAASTKPPATPSQKQSKAQSQPSTGAKSAFLKHANPSQGITEELLQTVFKQFGTITRCEIDKKKGLGYIDFSEPDALKKAMASSPVKVANGQVIVLENKSPQGKRGGQGQSQGGGNAAKGSANPASTPAAPEASAVHSPKPDTATLAPAATAAETPATPTTPTVPAGATPPTAPRGSSSRSGGGSGRGGRGGNSGGGGGGGRGNSRGSGQGGSKQGHRGGRGNQGSGKRSGAGGGAGSAASTPAKDEGKKD